MRLPSQGLLVCVALAGRVIAREDGPMMNRQAQLQHAVEMLGEGQAPPVVVETLRREAEANPASMPLQLLLGQALGVSGDADHGLSHMRRVYKLAPLSPDVPQLTAQLLLNSREAGVPAARREAVALLRTGLALQPADAEAYHQLGVLAAETAEPLSSDGGSGVRCHSA